MITLLVLIGGIWIGFKLGPAIQSILSTFFRPVITYNIGK